METSKGRILFLAAAIAGMFPAAALARCRGADTVSWYGEPQRVRSGARYDPDAMTCAHPTAPDGSLVRVTMASGRAATCTVNDGGPAPWTGCLLDVSRAMAERLGILASGVGAGTVQVLRFLKPAGGARQGVKKARPP